MSGHVAAEADEAVAESVALEEDEDEREEPLLGVSDGVALSVADTS